MAAATTRHALSAARLKALRGRAIMYGVAFMWLAVAAGPFFFMVLTAFKERFELLSSPLWAWPKKATLENFSQVFSQSLLSYLVNSITVVAISVTVVLLLSTMAAYAFSRIPFRFSAPLFGAIVAGLVVPTHVTLIPVYLLSTTLGVYDSLAALVGPYVAFNLPVSIFILTEFMRGIPKELEDAARIDGCGRIRTFFSVILPLSTPALVTVAIFNTVGLWNEFVFAFVLTSSSSSRTLPLAVWSFQGQYASNIPVIMAVLSLSALPVIVLYLFAQEKIVSGMMAGAVKG